MIKSQQTKAVIKAGILSKDEALDFKVMCNKLSDLLNRIEINCPNLYDDKNLSYVYDKIKKTERELFLLY